MQTVKIVSRILFYFARLLSFLYAAMAINSLIALSTGRWLLLDDTGKFFKVCFPFTQRAYLIGDYNLPYIIFDFLLPLALYSLFFLLLSNVFKQFHQPRLFTHKGVTHLTRFYRSNFIVPGVAVLLSAFFSVVDDIALPIIFFHAVLGIFAFFLAAIFKQGLRLQSEQDLFI